MTTPPILISIHDPVADALMELAGVAAVWSARVEAGSPAPILRRAMIDAARAVVAEVDREMKSFESQVKSAIAEADDPDTKWLSQDEVKARSVERREAWATATNTDKLVPNHDPVSAAIEMLACSILSNNGLGASFSSSNGSVVMDYPEGQFRMSPDEARSVLSGLCAAILTAERGPFPFA